MRRSFVRPFAVARRATVSAAPRPMLRRTIVAAVLAISLSGCTHSASVAPVRATAPVPVAAPAVVAPLPARITIARTVAERSYTVQSSATIERDSAGRTDTQRIDTRASIALSMTRTDDGALRGSGRVDAFTVQLSGAGVVVPLPSSGLSSSATATKQVRPSGFAPLLFDAALEATSVRVTARPPLINECDRNEAGATTLVHDLLVRVPSTIVVGASWRDSISSVLCRVGIPITVRAVHEYVVQSVDGSGATTAIRIRRTIATRLDGKVGSAWRTLELSGTGTGANDIRVDATSGAVQSIDGQYVLTLQLIERGRSSAPKSQRVTQKTTLHAETPR